MEFGRDAECASEILATVGALEPIEESDAVDVLATWKQTRSAMNQEKLSQRSENTCAPTLEQHVNHQERTSRSQTLLLGWLVALGVTNCLDVGYVSRHLPKKRAPASRGGRWSGSCSFPAIWSHQRLPTSSWFMSFIWRSF